VLVVLKDGTKFGGRFGAQSFASSDGKERDVYIEQVYEIDKYDLWTPSDQGVLILASEIRTIEFWPILPVEVSNERQGTAAEFTNSP
jgi:hypothetical protein